jgi:hypothetical protein
MTGSKIFKSLSILNFIGSGEMVFGSMGSPLQHKKAIHYLAILLLI